MEGRHSNNIERRVIRWAFFHQDELREAWNQLERGENPGRIPPLE
jgi:hypothetical protein